MSVGIALSSAGYNRPEEILRDADTAMYRAKALGGVRHQMFDHTMHAEAMALLHLETDLRRAVESKRFDEAQEAAIFLSIVFDSRVCHAIAPLLNAIPRFSTLLEGGNSKDSRWIETKVDLQVIERLLKSLQLKSGDRHKRK